jgi:cyclic pyranopterin phosphate synthase
MPEEGMTWMRREEILSFEEIGKIATLLASLGVTGIRLTGGEPLMRKDLHLLVGSLSRIDGITDLALTTNGYFLADQAEELAAAGLQRLNVSLDSLDPRLFEQMTRRDYLGKVLAGIDAALRAGFRKIKVNAVLIRGVNDSEIGAFAALAAEGKLIVRFIEFMPIGKDDGWTPEKVVSTAEVIETIRNLGYRVAPKGGGLTPGDPSHGRGVEGHPADSHQAGNHPAEEYTIGDGEIGFISSVSAPFCASCNRIRLTSDGKLRTCLFAHEETDLKTPLRAGASDEELSRMIVGAVREKKAGHLINRPGFVRPERTMSSIGG